MPLLYLDSNALAKLYLDEKTGKDLVLELVEEYGDVACCAIGYAEVGATIARYFHEGKLDEEAYAGAMANFSADWQTVKVQQVTPELLQVAAMLAKAQRGLRAMDALHLASALALRQSVSLRFVTFDARLEEAAKKLMAEAVA